MIYNLQLRNLNFNHRVLRDAAGTARSAVKTQQKFGEVLILGSDSGISNLIRYSKLDEICLGKKKKEKPVFFYLFIFFSKEVHGLLKYNILLQKVPSNNTTTLLVHRYIVMATHLDKVG